MCEVIVKVDREVTCEDMNWIYQAWDMVQLWVYVKMIMNRRIPEKAGKS